MPTPFGSEQYGVDAFFDEFERKQVIDGFSIDALWPGPVVVGDGFEGADASGAEAALEAAALALLLFERDEFRQPRLERDLIPRGEQAKEAEALDAVTECVDVSLGRSH